MIVVENARAAVMDMLAQRQSVATICPSEVARALAAKPNALPPMEDWRSVMPKVHEAIDQLVNEELVQLTWKGRLLSVRAGPYRIGRRPH